MCWDVIMIHGFGGVFICMNEDMLMMWVIA